MMILLFIVGVYSKKQKSDTAGLEKHLKQALQAVE